MPVTKEVLDQLEAVIKNPTKTDITRVIESLKDEVDPVMLQAAVYALDKNDPDAAKVLLDKSHKELSEYLQEGGLKEVEDISEEVLKPEPVKESKMPELKKITKEEVEAQEEPKDPHRGWSYYQSEQASRAEETENPKGEKSAMKTARQHKPEARLYWLLREVSKQVEAAPDAEGAKKLIIDAIDKSDESDYDKRKLKYYMQDIDKKEEITEWLWNTILAEKGLYTSPAKWSAVREVISSLDLKIASDFTSVLEKIAPEVERLPFEQAKELIKSRVEESKIKPEGKRKLLTDLEKITDQTRLLQWIWNAILAYKGLKTVKVQSSTKISSRETYSGILVSKLTKHSSELLDQVIALAEKTKATPQTKDKLVRQVVRSFPKVSWTQAEDLVQNALEFIEDTESK